MSTSTSTSTGRRPACDALRRAGLWQSALQGEPTVRVWNDRHHRYVDPGHPDKDPDGRDVEIDSDVDPADVRWRVRLELDSVFEFRRVRRQLPKLRRPIAGTGNRSIDLGATDEADAAAVGATARGLDGVKRVETVEIRGRLRLWMLRQRLAGNYVPDFDGSGPRYSFPEVGHAHVHVGTGWGDGGHGGHGGHGGGGHGGGHGG
jgi:hypothetical protein